MPVTAAKTLPERIMEARAEARKFRVQGDEVRAAMWDAHVDELLDRLPR